MKVSKQILVIGATIMFILSSCSIEKRVYMPGYHTDWHKNRHNSDKQELYRTNSALRNPLTPCPLSLRRGVSEGRGEGFVNLTTDGIVSKPTEQTLTVEQSGIATNTLADSIVQTETEKDITASANSNSIIVPFKKPVSFHSTIKYSEECDEVILKNGDIVKAKVIEIGITEIKYKKCDNLTGPTISILKSDVFMIKYANGTKEVFNTEKSSTNNSKKIDTGNATTDGFAIASLVTGILGLLFGLFLSGIIGIIFGILGIIFGAVSIGRIKKNPDKYNGKGLAVTGLISGIIITALFLLLVILVVSLI